MKVLFLNTAGQLGGAERSLLDLMASLREHAPDVEQALILGADGALRAEAHALGVHTVVLPIGPRLSVLGDSGLSARDPRALAALAARLAGGAREIVRYSRSLRAVVREISPTVVHSNAIKMHLLSAALRGDVPLVWHLRDLVGDRPVVSRAMRALAHRVDAAIAISHAVAENARPVVGRLPISVVHDAIDTDRFSPGGRVADLDALAGATPAPAGSLRVGMVATYARWKGHDVFLEAARRVILASADPNVGFYVVGGPIYDTASSQYTEGELRSMAARLGVDGVRFVPFQRNVDEVYRGLDVVVHASARPEPFGRVIAEAMASGRAVIAAREGGAVEIFTDGVDAVGFEPRDPDALAGAIRGLVVDEERRRELGRAARASTVARFSRSRLATQALEVYRDARRRR